MINFDKNFDGFGSIYAPHIFFVETCLILPIGRYTAYQHNSSNTKALTN
ncbi:hypothetical protein JIP1600_1660004 [Flavobacterium psychrophilum]|nr:hypothetical protein JIP1600_1660004 [Flavobacterium psychrophilum]